jgi:hypothetical protein
MPIRFYCPFCDQLLGISSRKVGAVVECPNCHGKVGVPGPDAVGPPLGPAGDVVLTPVQMVALGVLLLMLVGLAFAAGLLIGALT